MLRPNTFVMHISRLIISRGTWRKCVVRVMLCVANFRRHCAADAP